MHVRSVHGPAKPLPCAPVLHIMCVSPSEGVVSAARAPAATTEGEADRGTPDDAPSALSPSATFDAQRIPRSITGAVHVYGARCAMRASIIQRDRLVAHAITLARMYDGDPRRREGELLSHGCAGGLRTSSLPCTRVTITSMTAIAKNSMFQLERGAIERLMLIDVSLQ